MANSISYNQVGKWFEVNGTTYNLYGVMFAPWYNPNTDGRTSFSAVNTFSSVDLSNFQQWNEVCVHVFHIDVDTTTTDVKVQVWFKQYTWGGNRAEPMDPFIYYEDFEAGTTYGWYTRVGIDPDEIRPDYTTYKFYVEVNDWELYAEKEFSVSNLSFDTTPHPAWYMRVEWSYLCYVPPCIYSGSNTTWYKHMINPDSWYSWSVVWEDKAGYIWIPSNSSDNHIYYVNWYWTVARTKSSYGRNSKNADSSVSSDKAGYIRLTPSLSYRPEQTWYNYLCYIDGGWYKRRLWVWEI